MSRARSSVFSERCRPARGGSRRSPCTISRRSIASSSEQAAHPFRSWSASCRSTARDTPSSFTTRCRVSRFQRGFAGGFARPAMAPSASGSRWRKSWSASYALVMPAPTSCPRSAASRWWRRWSMRSAEATSLRVREAAEAIRKGVLSPVELVEACLARIGALDGDLRAWAHVDAAGALAIARERESEVRAGQLRGPLHGVPVGVKDIFDVAGMPTTGGARSFAHTRPVTDSAAVARIRAAGAIALGKTVTTEFAYRDPAPTRNPWNHGHTPGGSSAGSAAAVAARMVPLALGSQTVGSVLRPAAYCGVVGFKGTHGLVSVAGVIPLAWSRAHVGDGVRQRESRASDLPRRRDVSAGRARRAAVSHSARAGAGRSRLDGRRLALRALEQRRRARDHIAERHRLVGIAPRHPARPGRRGIEPPAGGRRLVRASAWVHSGPRIEAARPCLT